jgi:predicted flap endonuclease-1-like 5' DNA nuclease
MNWLSFFIGVLVGWIVEWLIDLFYWRRAYQSCRTEKEALQARLAEAERRIIALRVKGWDLESEPQPMPSADVAAERAAVVPPEVDLDADLEAPELAATSAEVDIDLEVPEVVLPDADRDINLEALDVVFPDADLPDSDIDDFFDGMKSHFPDVDLEGSIDRLKARFPDLDLKTALQGLKVDFPDLDIDGAFDSLKARFPHMGMDAAVGGVAAELGERRAELVPKALEERDNLKKIEGIGPKISQLLQDNGILTFSQLADTSIDRLSAILRAGGPRYQLADPTTWPEQAELAAGGAWDELQALQDRLTGGRKSRRGDR